MAASAGSDALKGVRHWHEDEEIPMGEQVDAAVLGMGRSSRADCWPPASAWRSSSGS